LVILCPSIPSALKVGKGSESMNPTEISLYKSLIGDIRSPKIMLPRFMDVLRTCLLIAVSSGAQTKESGRLGLLMSFGLA
jgi:hypothetical protein